MNFPSAFEFVKQYSPLIVSGPLAIVVGSWILWRNRTKRLSKDAAAHRLAPKGVGIGIVVIGVVQVAGVAVHLLPALLFPVQAAEVEQLLITRLDESGRVFGRPYILDNSVAIAEGLRTLTDARAFSASHEHFATGYRIEIRVEGESRLQRFLSVHRDSSRRRGVFVIIPHFGESPRRLNAGEYSSRAFYDWVEKTLAEPVAGNRRA